MKSLTQKEMIFQDKKESLEIHIRHQRKQLLKSPELKDIILEDLDKSILAYNQLIEKNT